MFYFLTSFHVKVVRFCRSCIIYLLVTGQPHTLLDDPHTLWFHCISSNSCPLNLLLVRSHQAEIIIVERRIQRRNNVTRVWVEPKSCDQGRGKNNIFTLSATLQAGLRIKYHILYHMRTHWLIFPSPKTFSLVDQPITALCGTTTLILSHEAVHGSMLVTYVVAVFINIINTFYRSSLPLWGWGKLSLFFLTLLTSRAIFSKAVSSLVR